MKLKNQTNRELVKEYIEKFHTVYNAMQQVLSINPYADISKFNRTIQRLASLINIHSNISKKDNFNDN